MITLDRNLLDRAAQLPRISEDYGDDSQDYTSPPIFPDMVIDGFRLIGSGCERTVWLGPDGYAYKVQAYDGGANYEEWRRSLILRANPKLPCWVYIPETAYDDVTKIAVAEFIRGEQPWHCYYDTCECPGSVCRWEMASEAFDYCGSVDGHAGNCVIVDGNSPDDFIVAVIDFTR